MPCQGENVAHSSFIIQKFTNKEPLTCNPTDVHTPGKTAMWSFIW